MMISHKDKQYIGGLIGLSRGDHNFSSTGGKGPRILNWMKWQGVIDDRIFAFYMAPLADNSFIDFGTYDLANTKDPAQTINWITVENQFFWASTVSGFRIGEADSVIIDGNTVKTSFTFPVPYTGVIFDTGTSFNYIPSSKYFCL